jgi:uncharacterized membrane protein
MKYLKNIFIFLFFLVFFIAFSCISLWRYNTAQIFYYDFGIFARSLWQIAHGLTPILNHNTLGEIHFLGDHFSPSLYMLTPLFWMTNSLQILLIEQALALTLSGYLIYLIARSEKLALWISITVSFIFLIFAGIVNPLVTDWHTEPTAALFLLLFIYLFFYKKLSILGVGSVLIFLGWKESNAISLILCLIPYLLIQKNKRIHIAIFMGISLIWFFGITKIIIPSLIKQPYYYSPVLPNSIFEFITNFVNTFQKRKLIVDSFSSFGFLPIIGVPFLFPIVGELGIRLVPSSSHFQSYTLGMHYNVFLGVFLALGTIYSLQIFQKKNIQICLTIGLLIISLIVAKKITSSPILLATNTTFWKEWNKKTLLFNELPCVPPTGSVMSQNNILPHLIQRKEKVYLLSSKYKIYKPKYIVMDLSSGQNPNNFYSGEINNYSQVLFLRDIIEKDINYVQDSHSCKYLLLFRRK